eukprot:1054352-Prymnesium_polylepis.1
MCIRDRTTVAAQVGSVDAARLTEWQGGRPLCFASFSRRTCDTCRLTRPVVPRKTQTPTNQ